MNAIISARLLLIAGIVIQTTTAQANTSNNNNNDNTTVSAINKEVIEQSTATEEPLAIHSENQAENAEIKLEVMLEKERQSEAESEVKETELVIETSNAAAPTSQATEMSVLTNTEEDLSTFNISNETSSTSYNFERKPLGSGDIFIPVVVDARVFAEFVDKLPAVVNYYTLLNEQEIINFYSESFGEPVSQERKRERLTVHFLLDGISTRVVISEQDNQQQVDVIQEESL